MRVRDNGMCMNRGDPRRVFEPVFPRQPKGTGLGPTIRGELIRLDGGMAIVYSEPGSGTTVTLARRIAFVPFVTYITVSS